MLVTVATVAEAHALVRSSDPTDGAILQHAPAQVTITFTERPDATLSQIHVLDAGGRLVERSPAHVVSGDPFTLAIPLPNLDRGVYTVTWRTISAVDGHVAAGSFAFGIGVSSVNGTTTPATPTTPPPSPLGVAGRWILYVGFALLMGGAWLPAFAYTGHAGTSRLLATAGFAASLIGLAVTAESQRATADIPWTTYLSSSFGQNLAVQLAPVLAAGLALSAARWLRDRGERPALGLVAALIGVAIFTHVLGSHAPSSRLPWLMVFAQWAHVAAFTVWIGGLAALLLAVRGAPTEWKTRGVRRFSFVAGIALTVLAGSGLLRAIDEVGAWSSLFSTLFGQLVLVKVALFGVLVSLGAVNRYRNVPLVARSLGSLRRVGRTELAVAAGVLVVAGFLTSLAPPSYSRANAAAVTQAVADGSDFGTTVRVRLTATPGIPGPSQFSLRVTDYDSEAPVTASRVALRFAFPALPTVGQSTLELQPAGSGRYAASGTNLSLAGRWLVTVVVERGLSSVEVPLNLTTVSAPEQIQTIPGSPTLFMIALPHGRKVQTYVDPARAGLDQVHVTFFDQDGTELPVQDGAVVLATPATGPTVSLPITRLSAGHFVGQGQLTTGSWRFDISAISKDGASYQFDFQERIH